jgi:hypothetical protein
VKRQPFLYLKVKTLNAKELKPTVSKEFGNDTSHESYYVQLTYNYNEM